MVEENVAHVYFGKTKLEAVYFATVRRAETYYRQSKQRIRNRWKNCLKL